MIQESLLADIPGIALPGLSKMENRVQMLRSSLPASSYVRPVGFPALQHEALVSLDIESRDPHLKTQGPGFVRGDASVIGVAVATSGGFRGYYPIAHEHERELNFDPTQVFDWLNRELRFRTNPTVAANALYDLEGLTVSGVGAPQGAIWDPQIAEALIDEEAVDGYSLDVLAKKYLARCKDEGMMLEAAKIYGIVPADVKSNLHHMSARFVGPYACEDAVLNLDVFAAQKKLLETPDVQGKNLWHAFCQESKLIPLLLKMRLKGVRVDIPAAEALRDRLRGQQAGLQRDLNRMAGFGVDIWAGKSLARLCDKLGLPYAMTSGDKPQPSFTKDIFATTESPVLKLVGKIRSLDKLVGNFVENFVLNTAVGGRVHCQFHQLRASETGAEGEKQKTQGARSGRFSSSNPNLQQIPIRDKEIGPLIRSLFIPESGCQWGCYDLTAQEPRWTVHYAVLLSEAREAQGKGRLPGALEVMQKYIDDEKTDYHQWVADMAELERKQAKEINLGLAYGMGRRKLAWKLGYFTLAEVYSDKAVPSEVDTMLAKYHAGVPFLKPLMESVEYQAAKRGYIHTEWGRKRHFNKWQPKGGKSNAALPHAAALLEWPGLELKRAFTHKSLNALIQGSSADHVKQIMLDLGAAGYVPHLTVHDEIDDSVGTDKQHKEILEIMTNAVKLRVPVLIDGQRVENWGKAK